MANAKGGEFRFRCCSMALLESTFIPPGEGGGGSRKLSDQSKAVIDKQTLKDISDQNIFVSDTQKLKNVLDQNIFVSDTQIKKMF